MSGNLKYNNVCSMKVQRINEANVGEQQSMTEINILKIQKLKSVGGVN